MKNRWRVKNGALVTEFFKLCILISKQEFLSSLKELRFSFLNLGLSDNFFIQTIKVEYSNKINI